MSANNKKLKCINRTSPEISFPQLFERIVLQAQSILSTSFQLQNYPKMVTLSLTFDLNKDNNLDLIGFQCMKKRATYLVNKKAKLQADIEASNATIQSFKQNWLINYNLYHDDDDSVSRYQKIEWRETFNRCVLFINNAQVEIGNINREIGDIEAELKRKGAY